MSKKRDRIDLFVFFTCCFFFGEWLIARLFLQLSIGENPLAAALYARCISAAFALFFLVPRHSELPHSRPWHHAGLVLLIYLGYLAALQHLGLEQPAFMDELSGISPWLLALSIAGLGASVEEYWFRGYLFEILEQKNSPPQQTIGISTVLFTLLHAQYDWKILLAIVPMGLLLGTMRHHYCSVLPGVLLHVLHNTLTLVVLLMD